MVRTKSFFINKTTTPLIIILLLFMPLLAHARTIALVYDDSGSMLQNDRFVFANYASQTLVSLLRDHDTFEVVNMSTPQTAHTFSLQDAAARGKSIKQLKSSWKTPVSGTQTPYQAVKTAMDAILKNSRSSAATAVDQKQDWLIITTDGEIDCRKTNTPAGPIRDLEDFITQNSRLNGRTVRIVFILIGADANKGFATTWQRTAPAHVEKIFHVTPEKLTETMEAVAALITGRDQKPLDVSYHGKTISFTSPFPLSRITVFQQSGRDKHAQVVAIHNGTSLQFNREDTNIISPAGKQHRAGTFKGTVSHLTARRGAVLPAGSYTISCDRVPDPAATKVFIEVAVDFTVDLLDEHGNSLSGQTGTLNRCRGEKLSLKTNFFNPLTRQPIIIDTGTAAQLSVAAIVDQHKILFHFDDQSHRFAPAIITVRKGKQSVSCQARSPSYFNFKSKIFTINGQVCERPWQANLTPPSVAVPYTGSNSSLPAAGASGSIHFKSMNKDASEPLNNCVLTAENLPAGISLTIARQSLSANNPTIPLPTIADGSSFPWSISRSKQFIADRETTIQLHFKSADSKIKWNPPFLSLSIKPANRTIIVEAVDPSWNVPVTKLGHDHPYGIRIIVNQQQLADEKYPLWHFTAEPRKRLGLDIVPAPTVDHTIDLVPRQYFIFPCFTQMGEQEIIFRAKGPFPGDQTEQVLILHVGAATWWQRYRSLILTVLSLLLAIWYIIGLLKKPRFSKKGRIVIRTMNNRKQFGRETKHIMASPWFKRYLVPYIQEHQTIKGITFTPRPGNLGLNLYNLNDRLKEKISIDDNELAEEQRKIIPWSSGSIMHVQAGGNQTYEMEYLN